MKHRAQIAGGDPPLNDSAERSRDLGQTGRRPRESGDHKAHRVIIVVFDHKGFLTAFWVPGQRDICEATPPGLIDAIRDATGRIDSQRADPQAKDQHRVRHRGR